MKSEKRLIAKELVMIAKALTAKDKRIDVINYIITNSQYKKIDGAFIDYTTAAVLKKIYDSSSPELQAKFEKMPIHDLIDLAWKSVR